MSRSELSTKLRLCLTLVLAIFIACGKKEEPVAPPEMLMPAEKPATSAGTSSRPKSVPKDFNQWPSKQQERYRKLTAEFEARVAETAKPRGVEMAEKTFDDSLKADDQKEMVRPAPPGFKPEPVPLKLKLSLIPKSAVLKPGEIFWYRVELQNLGLKTLEFNESRSFWKEGNAEYDKWKIYVTPPGGQEQDVMVRYYDFSALGYGARGRMNKQQLKDHAYRSSRYSGLHVDLAPGQTLVSHAWRVLTHGELIDRYHHDKWPPPALGEFRELALEEFKFDKPGTYRLRFVYKDYVPELPTEEDIQIWIKEGDSREEAEQRLTRHYKKRLEKSLGRVESNEVVIEVKP